MRPVDESRSRELNNTNAQTTSAPVFRTKCIVDGHETYAMIDSGASGTFISSWFVSHHGIATRKKKNGGYELTAVDGSSLPDVDSETMPLQLIFQQHHETVVLDVVPMARHDIVLGTPWLERHNPHIEWRKRVLTFERCLCVIDINPLHRQSSVKDEGRTDTQLRQPTTTPQFGSSSTDTSKVLQGHKVRTNEGHDAPSDIPKEFQRWKRLFQEETGLDALPKHQPWDHKIRLQPDKDPPWGPLYALSQRELEEQRKWIDKYLAKGWIRKSQSPAASPAMFVPKKPDKLRMVIDYRRLNAITIKNRYPLPNIEEMKNRLTGAQWFTKIDLRDAFHGIRMAEGEEWKTAFRTRFGLYEFLVMPFGLTNAPATYQEIINETLRHILDIIVIAYVDDLLVFTKGSREQHIKDVDTVFERLDKAGCRTAPEKCKFFRKEVDFLGFIVSVNGIRMDPEKITSIMEWPAPETVKDVQAFLGLANYNRKFIQDYSKIATPLTNLTRKDIVFSWGADQEKAFRRLKQASASAPTLAMFDPKKTVIIETDASDFAIGACLTQEENGNRHPIAYFSRKMSPAEQNYEIYDKELLAIVAALRHWRIYCEGASGLTIYSDHKNLQYFTTTKDLSRRQCRWSELLGQYQFDIIYTPGKDNGRADALSRRIDYMEDTSSKPQRILKINKDGSLSADAQEFNATLRILRDDQEQFPVEHGKFKVPPGKEDNCIRDHHDGPTLGHPGIARTTEHVRRNFVFPDMRRKVSEYIKRCDSCNKNKASRHAKYGNLEFREPPQQPWDEVTMDFIVKLPKSKDPVLGVQHDSILVMVDRLTKYSHFIPCSESINAEQLGCLVLDRLVRYHGIPMVFITDRDKLFTSNYWKTLVAAMGIKHKLSTAFHPQTDGQTERSNQSLEAYLRHYVNYAQDNWVSLLPMAQIALNNNASETTGQTPFFANHGKDPNLFMEPRLGPQTDRALANSGSLTDIHAAMRRAIAKSQSALTNSRHKDSKTAPLLKKGDKVYLLTKNLKTRRGTKKLDHVKVGPFLVDEQRGKASYKLSLPKDARIHPVFHISLLEPADPDSTLQTTFHFEPQEDDEFIVEEILEERGQHYLVKWKGYPKEDNTWEPKDHLTHCSVKLRQFRQSQQENSRIPHRGSSRTQPKKG